MVNPPQIAVLELEQISEDFEIEHFLKAWPSWLFIYLTTENSNGKYNFKSHRTLCVLRQKITLLNGG